METAHTEIASGSTPFGKAVKILVTGPEADLPDGYIFHDFHGNPRTQVSLAWWNADAMTWRDAALSVPDPAELPPTALPPDTKAEIYQADAPPVLVGHYKMNGEPRIDHAKASSIDYPATPCIYRWSGGGVLGQENLMKV